MDNLEPLIQSIFDEAYNDPNLTDDERKQIDIIQLNAMHRASALSKSKENRGEYTKALQEELKKHEAEVWSIRGRAANRVARKVENY
jgi:hypothetical protein